MARMGKWVCGVLVFLLLAAAGVFVVARMQGRSAERSAVVAMMSEPLVSGESNAFPAMWLLGYDVPEKRLAEVADADVARFVAERVMAKASVTNDPFVSSAGEFQVLSRTGGARTDWCPLDGDCLSHVRRHATALEAHMPAMRAMHAQVAALGRHGHYISGFPVRIDAPFPQHMDSVPSAALTYGALLYEKGDARAGLDAVCQVAAGWRPFVAGGDSLLVSMMAIRWYEQASTLFARMLSGQATGEALPASCAVAFAAPRPGEGALCEAMKGEFRLANASLEDPDVSGAEALPWYAGLALDAEATRGRQAEYMAGACGEQAERQFANDTAFQWPVVQDDFEIECLANPLGCVLTSVATPAYNDYMRRAQDHVMRMRLMSTLVWLHANDGDARPMATRIAVRPALLRSRERRLIVDDAGRTLGFRPYAPRTGTDAWRVPVGD